MKLFLILWLCFTLICCVGMTTKDISGDVMKGVVILALCATIYGVYIY